MEETKKKETKKRKNKQKQKKRRKNRDMCFSTGKKKKWQQLLHVATQCHREPLSTSAMMRPSPSG